MTNSGIDIEKESIDLAVAFCFLAEGKPSELWPSIKALCLRVEQAAIKAERDRCAEICQKRADYWSGDAYSGYGHMTSEDLRVKKLILAPNGDAK